MTKSLDLGCGEFPKNPFNAIDVYGIDVNPNHLMNIFKADLVVEKIPFPDKFFNFITAYDFIEHIPRLVYTPERRYSFVNLMSEINRVLDIGGVFLSYTPAFPKSAAWRDPTHVNIITEETFPQYFCNPTNSAKMYGFNGAFELEKQYWDNDEIHLISILRKFE